MIPKLHHYEQMIEKFLRGELSPSDFEHHFLTHFKADETNWNENVFNILDELFFAVDSFCADAILRDKDDFDEDQLRNAAQTALKQIRALNKPRTIGKSRNVGSRERDPA
jgi:hypothetical protein